MESKLACETLRKVPVQFAPQDDVWAWVLYAQQVGGYSVQYVLYRRLEVAQNFPSDILWHLNNNGSLAAVCQLKECLANPHAGGRPPE
jgi:hypothetical protein